MVKFNLLRCTTSIHRMPRGKKVLVGGFEKATPYQKRVVRFFLSSFHCVPDPKTTCCCLFLVPAL